MRFLASVNGSLAVVVPFHNEGPQLLKLTERLETIFFDTRTVLYFVDDCSTDGFGPMDTASSASKKLEQHVLRNDINLGHGPSVLKGISRALADGAEFVLTLDGDGNFDDSDLRETLVALPKRGWEVVVFSRTERDQSWFRKLVTLLARITLFLKVGQSIPDANSPFRLYRRSVANLLITKVSPDSKVPNLVSTIFLLRDGTSVLHRSLQEDQRGQSRLGVTWGAQRAWLPSRRFIAFCLGSLREVIDY